MRKSRVATVTITVWLLAALAACDVPPEQAAEPTMHSSASPTIEALEVPPDEELASAVDPEPAEPLPTSGDNTAGGATATPGGSSSSNGTSSGGGSQPIAPPPVPPAPAPAPPAPPSAPAAPPPPPSGHATVAAAFTAMSNLNGGLLQFSTSLECYATGQYGTISGGAFAVNGNAISVNYAGVVDNMHRYDIKVYNCR